MKRISSNKELHQNRRGIVVLWLILWGAMFLTFFCVVLEIATLWQAHVEVNNSLEAAALAAVKEWGSTGFVNPTQVPRNSGAAYGAANPVLGVSVPLDPNFTPAGMGNPNGNLNPNGEIVFGGLNGIAAPITFNPTADIPSGAPPFFPAVRVQKTIPVQGFCSSIFGFTPFNVSASTIAYFNTGNNQPALVSIP